MTRTESPVLEPLPQLEPILDPLYMEVADKVLDHLEELGLISIVEEVRARPPLTQAGLDVLFVSLKTAVTHLLSTAQIAPPRVARLDKQALLDKLILMHSNPTINLGGGVIEIDFIRGKREDYGQIRRIRAPLNGDKEQHPPSADMVRLKIF